jgi:hypothetical protein
VHESNDFLPCAFELGQKEAFPLLEVLPLEISVASDIRSPHPPVFVSIRWRIDHQINELLLNPFRSFDIGRDVFDLLGPELQS